MDPNLQLVDDIRLQAVIESKEKMLCRSQEDAVAALNSLSAIERDDHTLKEAAVSHFTTKYAKLSEVITNFSIAIIYLMTLGHLVLLVNSSNGL